MIHIRRLNVLGTILWWDAAAFVAFMISGLSGPVTDLRGLFERYGEQLYFVVLLACVLPLGVGWIIAVFHLATRAAAETRSRAWNLLLWRGPFGPGLYFSKLDENAALRE